LTFNNAAKDFCCDDMQRHIADHDVPLIYNRRFREYGIRIVDGGSATQLISFCPWCGAHLPSSLRDEWFERLKELNMEPGDPDLPSILKSDAWWRARD
jgi:hypothetical protein